MSEREEEYLQILIRRVEICAAYLPQFGQGKPVSFSDFQQMYGTDPFYTWFGLDHPMIYAAHKAAGGITSLYRQIGMGCENLLRRIICDQLGLTASQVRWSYSIPKDTGKSQTLSLDARIDTADIVSQPARTTFQTWLLSAGGHLNVDPRVAQVLRGCVFEVRQGYKSKDAKRQNADIANAGMAYAQGYLPIAAIFSTQFDGDVARRYRAAGWLLLTGRLGTDSTSSLYAFSQDVLGFDLASFFHNHAPTLRATVNRVMQSLLRAADGV